MSHTNSTTNYSLPQFLSTDKPFWLTDINQAYVAIDTGMKNAQDTADAASSAASSAASDATTALTNAATADAKSTGAIASTSEAFLDTNTYTVGDLVIYNNLLYICTVDVVTPGAWTGAANWTRTTLDDVIKGMTGETIPVDSNPGANSIKDAISESVGVDVLINDANGITLVRSGNTYYANFVSAPISNIVSALTPYLTVRVNSAIVFDFNTQHSVSLRLKNRAITFIDGPTWTTIANTSTDQIHGQIIFIKD